MEFDIIRRQSIIVWLYNLKYVKNIRKFGHVHFISKKLRYIVMYIDSVNYEETIKKIERLHFVQKIEISYRDEIDMTWKNAIPNRKDKDAIVSETAQTIGEPLEETNMFFKDLGKSIKLKEQSL